MGISKFIRLLMSFQQQISFLPQSDVQLLRSMLKADSMEHCVFLFDHFD